MDFEPYVNAVRLALNGDGNRECQPQFDKAIAVLEMAKTEYVRANEIDGLPVIDLPMHAISAPERTKNLFIDAGLDEVRKLAMFTADEIRSRDFMNIGAKMVQEIREAVGLETCKRYGLLKEPDDYFAIPPFRLEGSKIVDALGHVVLACDPDNTTCDKRYSEVAVKEFGFTCEVCGRLNVAMRPLDIDRV